MVVEVIASELVSTTSYFTVTGVEPMCGGIGRWRWSKWIQFLPTEVAIRCGYHSDGQIDAEVTGPVLDKHGEPIGAIRLGGVLFDGPTDEWPEWLRNLAVHGQAGPV